jgi:hypothetical protein
MVYPIISMITYDYFIRVLITFSIYQVTCPNIECQSEFHDEPCSELKGMAAWSNHSMSFFNNISETVWISYSLLFILATSEEVVCNEIGVLAHASICFLYFKMHVTHILNLFLRLKQKIRTCIFTCYAFTKSFHEKTTCGVACVERQNSMLKIRLFRR